ncbi:hypothetical protein [Sediminitomix flava]|uniref:N-acetyltransferase domain-containing protein n=1 Tax=Sediminitomix flava TaxID=379075 RepID=A0A315ZV34_SEDFL|nr:hypothetical protein [Sediminitomix flava]PWJ40039.1 hypothetical protein BC781_105102 [Sediminitomix flava]
MLMMKERGVLSRENYIEKLEAIARYFPAVQKQGSNAIVKVESPESNSYLNQAIIREIHPSDTTQNVDSILEFLDHKDKQFTLWCWENDMSEVLLEHIRLYKFKNQDVFSTLMAEVKHIHFDFHLLEGFEFKMVNTQEELKAFAEVHCELESDSQRKEDLRNFYLKLEKVEVDKIPHFELFYGAYEGEIIAVANMFYNESVVGIYDFLVKENFRNDAVFPVTFKHLLLEARKSGIPNCVLQVPIALKDKFVKYGFNEVSRVMRFS